MTHSFRTRKLLWGVCVCQLAHPLSLFKCKTPGGNGEQGALSSLRVTSQQGKTITVIEISQLS